MINWLSTFVLMLCSMDFNHKINHLIVVNQLFNININDILPPSSCVRLNIFDDCDDCDFQKNKFQSLGTPYQQFCWFLGFPRRYYHGSRWSLTLVTKWGRVSPPTSLSFCQLPYGYKVVITSNYKYLSVGISCYYIGKGRHRWSAAPKKPFPR